MSLKIDRNSMDATKLAIHRILLNCTSYQWSLQGLGMLRLYLSEDVRLHIWDSRFALANASRIHNHPWDFTSRVIVGQLLNLKYVEEPESSPLAADLTHFRQKLLCGPGGGLVDSAEPCRLVLTQAQVFEEGDIYSQNAQEIHDSRPVVDGTVTIVRREFLADADHAYVYWPTYTGFGSAEPKDASVDVVAQIANAALRLF